MAGGMARKKAWIGTAAVAAAERVGRGMRFGGEMTPRGHACGGARNAMD